MLALAVIAIVAGWMRFGDRPVDVLPEFEPPMVEVQTEALGLSAAEVEQFITVPLEQDLLNGVAFLSEIRSASLPGLSSIQMVFEPGTDLLDARQVVQERLAQAQTALPNVQTRPAQMLQPLSSTSRVMMIALSSDDLDQIDLSLLTRWTIAPKLLGVPGVANVAVWGFRDRQLQVLVDPARLSEQGVSLQDVIDTTASAQFVCPLTFQECSTPGTGGIIETANQRVGVQYVPVTGSPAELARVPIEDHDGLLLRDVARLTRDHQPLIGDAVGPDLLLVVQKFPGANTLDVTEGLESALATLRPGMSDVTFDTSTYRPATYVETGLRNLLLALAIGLVLALIALGLLLLNWRAVAIAVAAIATSLGAAALVLSITNASVNWMTLAGLVLALVVIVDEAIAASDGTLRAVRAHPGAEAGRVRLLIEQATLAMRRPAAYALVIALLCLVPLIAVGGVFGAFFPAIAIAYAIAIGAAMIVALLVTPALALLLGRSSSVGAASLVERAVAPRYARMLSRLTKTPTVALVIAGLLAVAGVASALVLQRSTMPAFKDTNLLVHVGGAPGTSLPEMQRVSSLLADELRSVEGVANVGAHVGRAISSDRAVGTNAGQLWVTVGPDSDHDATVGAIRDVVNGYPGLATDVVTYPNARVDEVLPAPEAPVVVRVYGQDYGVLASRSQEVRSMLTRVDGTSQPRVLLPTLEPTLEIETDLEAAAAAGVRPGDIRRAASAMISGLTVGSLFEDQKVFEVVVWGEPENRSNLAAVQDLTAETPDGTGVRLGDVADVRIAPAPTTIQHESVQRYLDVVADVEGRDVGDVLAEVRAELPKIEFPLEYHAEVIEPADGGSARQASILAIAAAVLSFLLLQVAVGSWRRAVIALGALVLALAGGAVATALADGTVSLGSVAGFVVILTLGAREAIALMEAARARRRVGDGDVDPTRVARDAAAERFPAIATTSTVVTLLFLPMAVAGPIAGLEVIQPAAVTALGGCLALAATCLFVVPGLVGRFGDAATEDMLDLTEDLSVLPETQTLQPIGGGS
jgi:Cu/Ag efflux pump CusA